MLDLSNLFAGLGFLDVFSDSDAVDTFRRMMAVDPFTMMVVGILAASAGMMVRAATDSTALAVIATPLLYMGALAGIYVCREQQVIFMYQKDANMIFSASSGMIVSLLVMFLAARVVYAFSVRSKTGLEARMTSESEGNLKVWNTR